MTPNSTPLNMQQISNRSYKACGNQVIYPAGLLCCSSRPCSSFAGRSHRNWVHKIKAQNSSCGWKHCMVWHEDWQFGTNPLLQYTHLIRPQDVCIGCFGDGNHHSTLCRTAISIFIRCVFFFWNLHIITEKDEETIPVIIIWKQIII